uniref:Uncharacterized protein AlNc14C225G9208 n=1 Tax=Albugo laibachii Nc14 TaxID=890382 RepID=F0WS70_9STRA|nr:conserved hypothetical protein [Albugo laibachii Nc14]CCA26554.1 conserved hypothetical protein [Albugo laibachii Nc14]|eukprot:CCA26554.1 conserved hypothetical protein [Albugo laibachii Nc14]
MLLPVLEHFGELGWQPFAEPAETYEFFMTSGLFKRARLTEQESTKTLDNIPVLVQRNTLFEICVCAGLGSLVAAYILAEENGFECSPFGRNLGHKIYVLKEPIAAKQWVRRCVEKLERNLEQIISEFDECCLQRIECESLKIADDIETLQSDIRQSNGLRLILLALLDRFYSATHSTLDGMDEETELAELTSAGTEELLKLLYRTQAISYKSQYVSWLLENNNYLLTENEYTMHYKNVLSHRAAFVRQFHERHGPAHSELLGELEQQLMIETVMKNAGIQPYSVFAEGSPPLKVETLLQVLHRTEPVDQFMEQYIYEMRHEPVESYFDVSVAFLFYFGLDRTWICSFSRQQRLELDDFLCKFRQLGDSLASILGLREDMKLTLLAIWLIENSSILYGDESLINGFYHYAVPLLAQASAMHLQSADDLEDSAMIHVVQTLLQRGVAPLAWKVWHFFGLNDTNTDAKSESAILLALEMNQWEQALMLMRRGKRQDMLEVILSWMERNDDLKLFVQRMSLTKEEEKLFHRFMLQGFNSNSQNVISERIPKRVDLVIMYHILRHQYEMAWMIHHGQIDCIRQFTQGESSEASLLLDCEAIRTRTALLKCSSPEPVDEISCGFEKWCAIEGVIIQNDDSSGEGHNMNVNRDDITIDDYQSTSSAQVCSAQAQPTIGFHYSPGQFSLRPLQQTEASPENCGGETISTQQQERRRRIESIDSTPVITSGSKFSTEIDSKQQSSFSQSEHMMGTTWNRSYGRFSLSSTKSRRPKLSVALSGCNYDRNEGSDLAIDSKQGDKNESESDQSNRSTEENIVPGSDRKAMSPNASKPFTFVEEFEQTAAAGGISPEREEKNNANEDEAFSTSSRSMKDTFSDQSSGSLRRNPRRSARTLY